MSVDFKKYINPLNFILGILFGLIIVNKFGWNVLQSWQVEYNTIAVEYLKILLALPAVALYLFLYFFNKFSSAIDFFIKNLRFKYKDIEATSQQEKNVYPSETQVNDSNEAETIKLSREDAQEIAAGIENLKADSQNKQQTIEVLQRKVELLAYRAEFFEFKYLNNLLVVNTKIVLRNLYLQGPITRDLFISKIFVPVYVADSVSEQRAIHSALLVNGLIEEAGSIISVSEKGERYLKFIGLINT